MTLGAGAAVLTILLCDASAFRVRPKRAGGKVVTVGDSFSSGTGIHEEGHEYDEEFGGPSGKECWREKNTTPGPVYAQANNMQSIFLACKGAEVPEIENKLGYLQATYPSDAAQKWNGSVILLTAGGNDIRAERGTWADVLVNCHWPLGDCDDNSENQVNNWATVRNRLVGLYSKLAIDASGARIRVLGYPRLTQRKGGSCWILPTLVKSELDWMDDMCDELNANIVAAMNTVKANYPHVDIQYVSVVNYITNGACESASNREVNDEVIEGTIGGLSDSSFHPTQKGYTKYYHALADSL